MAGDPETIGEVLAGAVPAGYLGITEEIARLADQLGQLLVAGQAAAASRQAISRGAAGGSNSGGLSANTILSMFGAGLGLSPLISGIASLFGGGGSSNSAPAPLVRFALPPSVSVNAGVNEGGGPAFAVDNPQGGLSRPVPLPTVQQTPNQVQAMDSQFFLDHSSDIAMAVRQAMLESSVLNDVVREA